MKTTFITQRQISRLLFLIVVLIFNSCKHDDSADSTVTTFHTTVPYFLSVTDARAKVGVSQTPKHLVSPGKIYTYGNYLFITETTKGIHIVDNTNPNSPRFVGFISLPGNADLAVNSNILYADNFVDLLAFDVSNPKLTKLVKKVNDVFETSYYDKARGIVRGYKDTIVTQVWNTGVVFNSPSANSSQGQSYGTGGSTARFTLMNNNLYTVSDTQLKLFNVATPAEPGFIKSIDLGWGIETIFPYQDKLFIGTTTGMQIYDASTPSAPVKLSTYAHFTSCDPVVVQGKYAYVTLRSGSMCMRGSNQLDVVNIEDATHPALVSSTPMSSPHGLTVNGDNLYICQDQYGLKAYDKSDILKIGQNLLSSIPNFNAQDVIAGPKSLIITGSDGVYQYDYKNPRALKLLSRIVLSKPFK